LLIEKKNVANKALTERKTRKIAKQKRGEGILFLKESHYGQRDRTQRHKIQQQKKKEI